MFTYSMSVKFTDFGDISRSYLLITPRRGEEVSPTEKQNKNPAPRLHLDFFFLETTCLPHLVAVSSPPSPEVGQYKSLNYSRREIALAKSYSDLNFFSWHSFCPATSDLISYLHDVIMW